LFSQASAPQGHLITKAWDTTQIWSGVGQTIYNTKAISNVVVTVGPSLTDSNSLDFIFTCTSTAHGLVEDDETRIQGLDFSWWIKYTKTWTGKGSLVINETKVITEATDDTFVFRHPHKTLYSTNGSYRAFEPTVAKNGTFSTDDSLFNTPTIGEKYDTRFRLSSFFLGRVWYAGLDETRTQNRVYFSQILDTEKKEGNCLTEADPTDQRISDPVATDGGYIVIADMARCIALVPYGNSMLCFATNGVWVIGPGNLGFFSPISYSLRQITNIGCVGHRSIVSAEGTLTYWANDGIYALVEDSNSGYLTVQNLTKTAINRLFSQINPTSRERAIGVYDDLDKRVIWFHGGLDTTSSELDGSLYFEKIGPTWQDDPATLWRFRTAALVYDLRTGAFYRYDFPADGTKSIVAVLGLPSHLTSVRDQKLKLLCYAAQSSTSPSRTAIYDYTDNLSWSDFREYPVDAYLVSGPDSVGDAAKTKTAPIVFCYFRRIKDSDCLLQPVWDWSKATTTGKVGNPMRVYREVTPNPDASKLVITRNKVLGKGHSLYLGFHGMPGKPVWLESWQVDYRMKGRS
jgi:hypothetical protein